MDIWDNKKIIDMWLLLHFIFGILAASILVLLDFEYNLAILIILVISIFWEIHERLIGIREHMFNSVLDITASVTAAHAVYIYIKDTFQSPYILYTLILLSLLTYLKYISLGKYRILKKN